MPGNGKYRAKRDRGREIDLREAARLIRLAGKPLRGSQPQKTLIANAAAVLGWPLRRVAAIWHREKKTRIDAWELRELMALQTSRNRK